MVASGNSVNEVVLPQLGGSIFLTESGLETDLLFNHGIDLPAFASFPLLDSKSGRTVLHDYYRDHWRIARDHDLGVVFETPTWRASPDWGAQLGYDLERLAGLNREAVELLLGLRTLVGATRSNFVVSGNVGPRGDGYQVGERMTVAEATEYHSWQVEVLAGTEADLVSLLTANYVEEALGFVNAAVAAGIPAVVSFTVETDGRLPDATALGDAIDRVDQGADAVPVYYMVNCAHPTHLMGTLQQSGPWKERLLGYRANASRMSHAELDAMEVLDAGDPQELGNLFNEVRVLAPNINILGGCCGTDARHVEAIAAATSSR